MNRLSLLKTGLVVFLFFYLVYGLIGSLVELEFDDIDKFGTSQDAVYASLVCRDLTYDIGFKDVHHAHKASMPCALAVEDEFIVWD